MSKAERAQSLAQLEAHVAESHAKPTSAHNTGFSGALRHARYILGENAVTGFAFALFLVIVLAALLGPYLVPYDLSLIHI